MANVQNILVVDDHLIVRKGTEIIIKNNLKDAILYNLENYEQALQILQTITIDVILLDININGIEDVKIMRAIKAIQPFTKILVFTSHNEKQYGLRYIQKGADGFLNKFCSEETLIEAITSLFQNGYYYSNELKGKLENNVLRKDDLNTIDLLSNREYEIANLLIKGYGNLEISNKLNIQMSTVSTYKNRIFEKLHINNIVMLSDIMNLE